MAPHFAMTSKFDCLVVSMMGDDNILNHRNRTMISNDSDFSIHQQGGGSAPWQARMHFQHRREAEHSSNFGKKAWGPWKTHSMGIVTGWLDLMICPQAILSLKPYFREFWDHDPHDHWSDDQMSNWQCNGCCQSRGDGWGWTSSSRNCSNPCIITRNPLCR